MRDPFSGGDVRIKYAIGIVCGLLGLIAGALIAKGF